MNYGCLLGVHCRVCLAAALWSQLSGGWPLLTSRMEWINTGDQELQSEIKLAMVPGLTFDLNCSQISDEEKSIIRSTLLESIEEPVSQVHR